jgi:hypothetical protein
LVGTAVGGIGVFVGGGVSVGPSVAEGGTEVPVSVGAAGVPGVSVGAGVVGSEVAVPVSPGVSLPSGGTVAVVGPGVTVSVTGVVTTGGDVRVAVGTYVGGYGSLGNHNR